MGLRFPELLLILIRVRHFSIGSQDKNISVSGIFVVRVFDIWQLLTHVKRIRTGISEYFVPVFVLFFLTAYALHEMACGVYAQRLLIDNLLCNL